MLGAPRGSPPESTTHKNSASTRCSPTTCRPRTRRWGAHARPRGPSARQDQYADDGLDIGATHNLPSASAQPVEPRIARGGLEAGGASAAVAAGWGPLAIASDGGGLIRIPAPWAGNLRYQAHLARSANLSVQRAWGLSHIGPHDPRRWRKPERLMPERLRGPDGAIPSRLPGPRVDLKPPREE